MRNNTSNIRVMAMNNYRSKIPWKKSAIRTQYDRLSQNIWLTENLTNSENWLYAIKRQ